VEGGLVELAARGAYATDKSERYLRAYEPFLAPLRDPHRGTPPQRESRIERMQVGFGQVFVVKPR
jgi:hypothetical protein